MRRCIDAYLEPATQSISTEVRGFTERQLLVPDENSLLRLPDDCFYVWLNKPERDVVLGIRDERPGEEKILQLCVPPVLSLGRRQSRRADLLVPRNLETHLDPERFTRELLVFRKDRDDTTLRLCDTTENFEIGSRSSEGSATLRLAATRLPAHQNSPSTAPKSSLWPAMWPRADPGARPGMCR